jgi:hypothetical protein
VTSRKSILSICLPACLPVCLSVCLSIYLSVCLPASLSVCLSVYLSIYLYIYIYVRIYLSVYVSIYLSLSMYVSICLRIYLSICLSACLPASLSVCLSIRPSIYGSTALLGLDRFFSFVIFFTQTVGLLGRGISPSQGRYLDTEQHKHRINEHSHPCLEWDSNPRSQCSSERRQFMLRPRGHCDRLLTIHGKLFSII